MRDMGIDPAEGTARDALAMASRVFLRSGR